MLIFLFLEVWYLIPQQIIFTIFSKAIFHATCFPYNVTWHSSIESEWDCLQQKWCYVVAKAKLQKNSTFSNSLPGPHGSWPLELSHYAVRKPSSHGKIIRRCSVHSPSWDPSQRWVPEHATFRCFQPPTFGPLQLLRGTGPRGFPEHCRCRLVSEIMSLF